ncbi:aminotransferase class III-fold pyridoxal phosphate-dependent enzyme, partial [Acinetobacter bereziniae]|nr:aminotransferase class III-fold pyridoxal phosphate-dependent enzyme [Acinetobacter bereziniae]
MIALVQARMGSKRLPGKVLRHVSEYTLIQVLLERLSKSKKIDQIILASSVDSLNDELETYVKKMGFPVERGSEDNVLERFYFAARAHNADIVIRITGDCPLVDSELVDQCIQEFLDKKVDYLSNTNPPTFPDGLDVEVFSFNALERAYQEASSTFDLEHVTPYLRTPEKFTQASINNSQDYSNLRWTVDELVDLEVIKNIFEHFAPNIYFHWQDVLKLQETHPTLFKANTHINRNSGANMSTGQKLWKRAKDVIPGGNMLLSKRAEMFLPEKWPAYFSKAKGCSVWDLDNIKYTDMSIMGIGTNTLGYGHPEVDDAVLQVIQKGNMSTLNAPEEVYLAEKLIELHPWADMVRFARSGGEANAIAIRIARAFTGKDKVAVCGYHGWHDWYLSANLGDDENLAGHLLPGLEPKGVPSNLRGTVFPFQYNNFEQLENLVKKHEIGVIKMEVVRNMGPENNFLQKVRNLATEKNIVLIFDECTSGFRETFGGLHKKYGVEPDMAMFGKALGNGYAVTATIGRKEIMQAAQATFISSTFWTERIGSAAGLKTLEVMQRDKSWEKITATGLVIREKWQNLADKYDLNISHWGLPALTGFSFSSENALAYKTLITQEMLKSNYLASNCIYVCTEHTTEILNEYFELLDPIFKLVKECEEGRDVIKLLESPICHG